MKRLDRIAALEEHLTALHAAARQGKIPWRVYDYRVAVLWEDLRRARAEARRQAQALSVSARQHRQH